jgi:hypothetical protein
MLVAAASSSALTQQPPPDTSSPRPAKPATIEKLGANTYNVGRMLVDTAKREVTIPGTANSVVTLEFVANTNGGSKAYESAITLDTNAISFNAAMLLIGLDPSRSRAAMMQFDKTPPAGDPVEIYVEWESNRRTRRIRVEELLYDSRTKKTLKEGPWVYTGSTFVETGNGRQFLAELDGVLIGFMHGPQAIIDNPRNDAVDGFGSVVLNPTLGLTDKTPLKVIVKALPLGKGR